MLDKALTSRLYYKVCCFVLFALSAAASFSGFYQQTRFSEPGVPGAWYQASFEAMVNRTAYRPYVYRQMLPTFANWLDRIVPQSIKTRLYDRQGTYPKAYINAIADSPTASNKVYFFRYLVVYIASYIFALIAVYAMFLVCTALDLPPPAAVFAPVIIILLVPFVMSGGGYFYDYPELAFLALAVWVALKFDWWWMIPLAALGTWNKESFLLFIPTLYPIFRRRSSRLGSLIGVGVLCFVCLAVYYQIRLTFAHNPGSTVIFSWPDEVQLLRHPGTLITLTKSIYGLPMLAGYTVAPALLLIWTVLRGWQYLPSAIKQHAQISAVINIPLYLLFVEPGKLRDLSMLYIVFLLLLAVNLKQWIVASERAKPLQEG
ncbi:MAG TPA: hypothetical protein VGT08_19950 [Terracidiphilus sp.]|nr:hypothetical protein [Terracidiphilus sp.]